jgi:hypothetical protein
MGPIQKGFWSTGMEKHPIAGEFMQAVTFPVPGA